MSLKDEGLIDLKDANKKPLSLVYAEPDADGDLAVDPDFAAKLRRAAGVSEESILIIIDSDGSLAAKAAAAATQDEFFSQKVYWVRGGVEGPTGWKASDLPTKPYRVFELQLPSLELPAVDLAALAAEIQAQVPGVDFTATVGRVGGAVNSLTDKYQENPTLGNGVLAAAGVAAAGVFAITELEAVLQLVGALGVARLLTSNLLFAKDREATLAAARAFLKERGLDTAAAAAGGALQRRLGGIAAGGAEAGAAATELATPMVPEAKGANPASLAAALAAAGLELELPLLGPSPAAAPVLAAQEPPAAVEVAVVARAEAALPAPSPAAAGPVAASEAGEPAAHVLDARAWIATWKNSRHATALAVEAVVPADAIAVAGEAKLVVTTPQEEPTVLTTVVETVGEPVLAPANVLEAREWIAAWKAGAAATKAAEAEAAAVPANVLAAREWIAAWKSGVEAAGTAAVATVTAAAVTSVLESHPAGAVAPAPQAAGTAIVPANVLQAREWIAAWKGAGGQAAVFADSDGGLDSDPAVPLGAAAEEAVLASVVVNVPA